MGGLTGGGAFRTDPLRISTLNKILFIMTDALNIHMAFVCIGTLFSPHTHTHTHTHTHSVRQTHNKPSDPRVAERGMESLIPVIVILQL